MSLNQNSHPYPRVAGPGLPSSPQMADNLAQTAGSVINNVINGQSPMVNDDEFNRRLSICGECEYYMKEQNRCLKCGCMMNFKAKFNGSKCPVDKW